MANKLSVSILFIILQTYAVCCDCVEVKRDSAVSVGLKISDLVFTGELIKAEKEERYSFKINEIFKGVYERDTIWGESFDNCSIYPDVKGLWIVYATKKNDTTIVMNPCLHSLPLNRPEGVIMPLPESIHGLTSSDSLEYIKQKLDKRTVGVQYWISDYLELKKYKELTNTSYSKSYNTATKLDSNPDKSESVSLRDTLLGISLLLNILVLLLIYRKRKASR